MDHRYSEATKAIREYMVIPADIKNLVELANQDLWFGPVSSEDYPDYPGFATAVEHISAWASEAITGLYVQDGGVSTVSPEGEWVDADTYEPCDGSENAIYLEPEEYYYFEARDLCGILLGEISKYF